MKTEEEFSAIPARILSQGNGWRLVDGFINGESRTWAEIECSDGSWGIPDCGIACRHCDVCIGCAVKCVHGDLAQHLASGRSAEGASMMLAKTYGGRCSGSEDGRHCPAVDVSSCEVDEEEFRDCSRNKFGLVR